jgi:hypothetical protein
LNTPLPLPADEVGQALSHISFALGFAYEQGLHEFGYDPVAVVVAALAAGRVQPETDTVHQTNALAEASTAHTPVYIEVSAEVRYWEDATVNGVEDTDGGLIPFKQGALWRPTIRLSDGAVMDWPVGTVADVHYKVADQGEYWLLGAGAQRVAKWAGYYVPDAFLCHGDTGYGDYIILKINAEGVIQNWTAPDIEFAKEDEGTNWKRIAASGASAGAQKPHGQAGWQPIETAPKDGSTVLLAESGYTDVGFWHDGSECHGSRGGAGWFSEDDRNNLLIARNIHPEHWMPLPAAPSRDPAAEGSK